MKSHHNCCIDRRTKAVDAKVEAVYVFAEDHLVVFEAVVEVAVVE